ncbi:MAG: hypothetical protein KIT36_00115 [Alphaproteobacteria bacterium]|nr:hypothetical protein [Alphaproteobacteria bacterium]
MQDVATLTVREIAAKGGMLDVECRACGRITKLAADHLAPRYADRRLADVPLRCGQCGAGGSVVRFRCLSPLFADRHGKALRLRALYAAGQELRLWCSHCTPPHEVRFVATRDVEEQLGSINPTVGEACHRLVCPDSGKFGMVGVAAVRTARTQMTLPLRPRSGRPQ